ncbi:MAG TPA: Co2+/Mg2+ efflux protein ApaG [Caulobacteraceae bacterium]|nr:Co2+/Mg2+ efflux protein ApaG [Caulobacteraceae bacterium]
MRRPGRPAQPERAVYQSVTRSILVRVAPSYLADDSEPQNARYVWAYTVEIENHGSETVQLMSRHWIITDAMNRVEEVEGDGVVGEQPVLGPREAFRYSSGCPLQTPSGTMRGSYRMVTEDGEAFDVAIPEFSLHLPGAASKAH